MDFGCPLALLRTLPFTLISNNIEQLVSHSEFHSSKVSSMQELTRCYLNSHVESLKQQFKDFISNGQASSQDLANDRDRRSQNWLNDVMRWEQWEARGGLKKVNARPKRPNTSNGNISKVLSCPGFEFSVQDDTRANGPLRADIETRCLNLVPPIPLEVLNGLEAFHEALLLGQPLTEEGWRALRSRLLAQVFLSEYQQDDQGPSSSLIQEDQQQHKLQEEQVEEDGTESEGLTGESQDVIKRRLDSLASEVIRMRWHSGTRIDKDICPEFAADILTQVCLKYVAGAFKKNRKCVVGDVDLMADGVHNNSTHVLRLEDMKWVFDNKIRPFTDPLRKDLFLCNGCRGTLKTYGFEGVVQHYAAKHTSKLSLGSVVVNWRAEWPKTPPFRSNPVLSKAATDQMPISEGIISHVSSPKSDKIDTTRNLPSGENGEGFALSQNISDVAGQHCHSLHVDKASLEQVSIFPYRGRAATPLGFTEPGTVRSQFSTVLKEDEKPCNSNRQEVALKELDDSAIQHTHSASAASVTMTYSSHYPVLSSWAPRGQPNIPRLGQDDKFLRTNLYHRQIEVMAYHAKDVFANLGTVRELPGSVRVFVTIQHTVSRFNAEFRTEPSLSMFIDGLDHSAIMRPVRSINGLACRACNVLGFPKGMPLEIRGSIVGDYRLYTLPHLVNHFRASHSSESHNIFSLGSSHSPTDWKLDMIDLPDKILISKLVHAQGMTESNLNLIASVIPTAFPFPFTSAKGDSRSDQHFKADPDGAGMPLAPKLDSMNINRDPLHEPRNDSPPTLIDLDPSIHPGSSKLFGDDEYDPRRPALMQETVLDGKMWSRKSQDHLRRSRNTNASKWEDERHKTTVRPESRVHTHVSKYSMQGGRKIEDSNPQPFQGRPQEGPPQRGSLHASAEYKTISAKKQRRKRKQALVRRTKERDAKNSNSSQNTLVTLLKGEQSEASASSKSSHSRYSSLERASSSEGNMLQRPQPRHDHDKSLRNEFDRFGGNAANDPMLRPLHSTSINPSASTGPIAYHNATQRDYRPNTFDTKPLDFSTRRTSNTKSLRPVPSTSAGPLLLNTNESGRLVTSDPEENFVIRDFRGSRLRRRSRSPVRQGMQNKLYRTRSPAEEDRRGTHYLVPRSGSHPSRRATGDIHAPNGDLECVHEESIPLYTTHYEYKPNRFSEPVPWNIPGDLLEYVVSKPRRFVDEPGYARRESKYSAEIFYEIDGHLVPASSLKRI